MTLIREILFALLCPFGFHRWEAKEEKIYEDPTFVTSNVWKECRECGAKTDEHGETFFEFELTINK